MTEPVTPPTPAQLQEWRELAAGATPGPWAIGEDRPIKDHPGVVIRIYSSDPELAVGLVGYFKDEHEAMARADARLIAAAREAVPALVAEVERQRGEQSRSRRQALEEARTIMQRVKADLMETRTVNTRLRDWEVCAMFEHRADGVQRAITVVNVMLENEG